MEPTSLLNLLKPFLGKYARDLTKEKLSATWQASAKSIATRMHTEKILELGNRQAVRFALFWLCRSITKNGHLADVWRDIIDDHVLAEIGTIPEGTPEPTIVARTIEVALEVIF